MFVLQTDIMLLDSVLDLSPIVEDSAGPPDLVTVLTVLTVQPVDIVETENTVVTVEIVETEETVLIEDLKKYELPKNSVVLLTANMDTRDASASKNLMILGILTMILMILRILAMILGILTMITIFPFSLQ